MQQLGKYGVCQKSENTVLRLQDHWWHFGYTGLYIHLKNVSSPTVLLTRTNRVPVSSRLGDNCWSRNLSSAGDKRSSSCRRALNISVCSN